MKSLVITALCFIIWGAYGEVSNSENLIFSSSDQSRSLELYHSLKLYPVKKIKLKNAVYHVSELFKFVTHIPSIGSQRYGVFISVEVDGKKYFRFFYKSGSHGIFRLAPFVQYYKGKNHAGEIVSSIMWYSKGIGEGSLALPPKLQIYLAKEISKGSHRSDININHIYQLIPSHNEAGGMLLNESFEQYDERKRRLFNDFKSKQDALMAKEVSFARGLLIEPLLEERSFIYKREERSDVFAKPESVDFLSFENTPDYSVGPLESEDYLINYYGQVSGFEYWSKNQNISYYILKNQENKIWIPSVSILGKESKITSYGVPSKALSNDEALFLIPLWERSKNIHPDYRSIQKIPREEKYQSSWVYLREIPMIKEFYETLGVPVPEDQSP